MIHPARRSESLGAMIELAGTAQTRSNQAGFGEQFARALQASASATEIHSETGDNFSSSLHQIFGPKTTTSPSGRIEKAADETKPALQLPTAEGQDHQSVAALKQAMADIGMDVTDFGFEYVDQVAFYPGGSYTNRMVTVTLPDGTTENLGADLVLSYPDTGARDIQWAFTQRSRSAAIQS